MSLKKIIVIDVSSLLFRAFFALPPLNNSKGVETGAAYGFVSTLLKAISDLSATDAVACFDSKAKTFRHEQFKEYKAHRPVTPSGIVTQIPLIEEVLKAFSIPCFKKDGVEADDLIATICTIAQKDKDIEIYIVSGDLDNLQLVNDKVKLYTLGRSMKDTVIYDKMKVEERFGVEPSQMNELKALTGDSSDNIPGAKGIGKKTAAEIINRYNTVEELYEELATDTAVLKPKVKESLKENKEKVLLSRQLVETKKDVDIDFDIKECNLSGVDKKQVEELFLKLEFKSLLPRALETFSN